MVIVSGVRTCVEVWLTAVAGGRGSVRIWRQAKPGARAGSGGVERVGDRIPWHALRAEAVALA
jgi:hypothetical protein